MTYTIHTPSATRLKQEILKRVEEKADANGKGIVTWQIAETDDGAKVLVHTADQWAEKGGIVLKQVPVCNEYSVCRLVPMTGAIPLLSITMEVLNANKDFVNTMIDICNELSHNPPFPAWKDGLEELWN